MNEAFTAPVMRLYRLIFASVLATDFARLLPSAVQISGQGGHGPATGWPWHLFPNVLDTVSPEGATGFLAAMVAACCLFALGRSPKLVSLVLLYGFWCVYARGGFGYGASVYGTAFVLLLFAIMPREIPGVPWRVPKAALRGAWGMLAVLYGTAALAKLRSGVWLDGTAMAYALTGPEAYTTAFNTWLLKTPLMVHALTYGLLLCELAFVPFVLFRGTRRLAWWMAVACTVFPLALVGNAAAPGAVGLLLLFVFDPAWIPARRPAGSQRPVVFFDGECGLCHRTVSFMLAESPHGVLDFAPLQGSTAATHLTAADRDDLSSLVLRDETGTFRRSAGVLRAAGYLGGIWRLVAGVAWWVPRPLRDFVYRGIARIRHRLVGPPATCRSPSPSERARFLS